MIGREGSRVEQRDKGAKQSVNRSDRREGRTTRALALSALLLALLLLLDQPPCSGLTLPQSALPPPPHPTLNPSQILHRPSSPSHS